MASGTAAPLAAALALISRWAVTDGDPFGAPRFHRLIAPNAMFNYWDYIGWLPSGKHTKNDEKSSV
jgi:hypothetical protein